MGTDKTRRTKQEWFQNAFNEAKKQDLVLSKQRLLPLFALQCFSTLRTGLELLQIYEQAGVIEVHGDEIIVK